MDTLFAPNAVFASPSSVLNQAVLKNGILTIGDFTVSDVAGFVGERLGYGYYYTDHGDLYEITDALKPELALSDVIDLTYSSPAVYALTKSGEVYSFSNSGKTRVLELTGKGIVSLDNDYAASANTVYYLLSVSMPERHMRLVLLDGESITNFAAVGDFFSTGTKTYMINSFTGDLIGPSEVPPFEYGVKVFPYNYQTVMMVTSDGTTYLSHGSASLGRSVILNVKNVVLASRLGSAPPDGGDQYADLDEHMIPGAYIMTAEGGWYVLDSFDVDYYFFNGGPEIRPMTAEEAAKLDVQGEAYKFQQQP
jgi:hypothetical protein